MNVKCRRTTQYTNGIVTGYFVADPCFGKTAIIGRPRLKLRYHVLQNCSNNPQGIVFAGIRGKDWYSLQNHFEAGPEWKTSFVKAPLIRIGQLNENSAS